MPLDNSRVLVLGGSSGIGLAIALEAQAQGACVTIAARDARRLERARAILGPEARTEQADVADEGSVRGLLARSGELSHVVVTAASVAGAPIRETDVENLQHVVDSRLWGAIYVAKHAIDHLTPDGSLTFMSGASVWKPVVGGGVGTAAAGGVEALARTLAIELAPVRVNCLRPGVVDTPLLDAFFGERKGDVLSELIDTLPVGRVGTPEDIAQAAVFLMTNRYVTGTVLTIDGGHRLL